MSGNRQMASPFHNRRDRTAQASQVDAESELEGLCVHPYEGKPMKRISSVCLMIGLLALSGCKSINVALTPEAETKSLMTPLVEKRETITATGYAVVAVQNHKNPAQQRLMAIRASKLDAYRNLTEQVYGQQLDASSTVADMVVTNDTFRTKVEGVIYGARLVSITPVGEDTYETTLSLDKDVVQDLRVLYMSQLAAKGR
jgi:hypothetical protein